MGHNTAYRGRLTESGPFFLFIFSPLLVLLKINARHFDLRPACLHVLRGTMNTGATSLPRKNYHKWLSVLT